jgi:UDP-N-acetylglucosamine transferase subunit ALG13
MLDGADVLWQTGATDTTGLGIEARATVPHAELLEAVRTAEVVVAHSGTGSAISAFEQGKCPILVPRRQRHGEHVDDHQVQIAGELSDRGLAIECAVEDLTIDVLATAAARSTLLVEDPPVLKLAARTGPT